MKNRREVLLRNSTELTWSRQEWTEEGTHGNPDMTTVMPPILLQYQNYDAFIGAVKVQI